MPLFMLYPFFADLLKMSSVTSGLRGLPHNYLRPSTKLLNIYTLK